MLGMLTLFLTQEKKMGGLFSKTTVNSLGPSASTQISSMP